MFKRSIAAKNYRFGRAIALVCASSNQSGVGTFFGYGFTKPTDDLGSHNPPAYPDMFEYLSQEFRDNGYDLRKLTAWIVLSKPYFSVEQNEQVQRSR